MAKNKAIKDLKIQSSLPLNYSKDNQPQSSTSVNLSYVFNPVFHTNDIDSIDLSIAKEIELTRQELSNAVQSQKIYESQRQQYEQQKAEALQRLAEVELNLNSQDLAIRERAIKDINAVRSRAESFNQIKNIPVNPIAAINIKMNFLQSKLHNKKSQKITAFISYFIIQPK